MLVHSKRDIASEAFNDAIRYLETEFAGDKKALAWLDSARVTSLTDLLDATRSVEEKYTNAARNRRGLMTWLRGLSSRIMHYGQVMDTLAQHHPEYVSLVWGIVKFILMVFSTCTFIPNPMRH